MLSIEECRKTLGEAGEGMTDERVQELRDTLYAIVENILDKYIDSCQ